MTFRLRSTQTFPTITHILKNYFFIEDTNEIDLLMQWKFIFILK